MSMHVHSVICPHQASRMCVWRFGADKSQFDQLADLDRQDLATSHTLLKIIIIIIRQSTMSTNHVVGYCQGLLDIYLDPISFVVHRAEPAGI